MKFRIIHSGFLFLLMPFLVQAQSGNGNKGAAAVWVDSVFQTLTPDEKIAQLLVVRAHSNLGPDHVAKVVEDIQKYNIGALCFFQGGPVRQAVLTNYYQSIAKTPIMVTIDAEWGLGMRLDSVTRFPYQLTLGALNDQRLVYEMGLAVAEQCKRMGIHVNYAPVIDVNNNPRNPVIGYRSFGEDKLKVSSLGIAYMKGMQDGGIMACAKHFPGHGDTEVDSHLDLPLINKTMDQLDSLELMPFRDLFEAGVGSVMIAHLYIPSIDTTKNLATSLSKNNVTGLLRNNLGYQGLTFTDALEMKGVSKFFPSGQASAEAIIAGNDMLCLPASVPEAIEAIKKVIDENRVSWDEINEKVKKVLRAKYSLGLSQFVPIDTGNLVSDLNARTDELRTKVARRIITVLKNDNNIFPLQKEKRIAYVGIGVDSLNTLGSRLVNEFGADSYLFSYKDGDVQDEKIFEAIASGKYDAVVIGIHNYNNRPTGNYGISPSAISLWRKLQSVKPVTFVFGNVYAASNFCSSKNLVACYQDEPMFQDAAADLLAGTGDALGRLPVTICGSLKFGTGTEIIGKAETPEVKLRARLAVIDDVVQEAISKRAFPGCVIMAAHNGEIIFNKAFGYTTFDKKQPVTKDMIFDLASVTKISATTLAVMELYEQGKLDLRKKLGDYLAWVRGSNKAQISIEDLLLHQGGLVPFIPFYRETIDTSTGNPDPDLYSDVPKPGFSVRVAECLYIKDDWQKIMFDRILASPLGRQGRYVYSDNDFIFLGKIVEAISGMSLDQYVHKTFYSRMGLKTIGFKPRERFPVSLIVPTEEERHFRQQLIRADVHDEGASLFGGVAGHAGLFSDAYDLVMLYQMLLNGGELNGERFLKEETIRKFTAYGSKESRRGLGFDKPEKDNALKKDPYPSAFASPETYGHTGFTGTCVWVDPKQNLVYVFLSNRVNPTRNNSLLTQLNVRGKIQDLIIEAIR